MSLSVQFLSLLAMIGTGVLGGALIDFIFTATSAAGKKSKLRKWSVWLEIAGWIIVGFGTFYVLFVVRDGAWRMYDPVAQVCGLLLYGSIFHRPFRLLGRILLLLFIKPVWKLLLFVIFIIHRLLTIIFRILFVLSKPLRNIYGKVNRKLFPVRKK